MQWNSGLRDPFATEEDEIPSSAGRPPLRSSRSARAPLRNVGESSNPIAPRFTGSLGPPRSSISRTVPSSSDSSGQSSTAPPRSLGLSLGLPRNRMTAAKRDNLTTTSDDNASTNTPAATKKADDAVRNTDSDALLSRLSALKLGYLTPEPFTQEFSTAPSGALPSNRPGLSGSPFARPNPSDTSTARRSPLISIGTYLRCTAIDAEVESFLKRGEGLKQIISIGAGSDSRYWRIMSDPPLSTNLHHYVEIDFAENTSNKVDRILRSSILRSLLDPNPIVHGVPLSDLSPSSIQSNTEQQERSNHDQVLRSSKYSLIAADVRNLHPDTSSSDRIQSHDLFGPQSTGLKAELPTLVLFECVLAYILPEKADWMIKVLGETFDEVEAVSYDIALVGEASENHSDIQHRHPHDAKNGHGDGDGERQTTTLPPPPPSRFGKIMLSNLEMRNLSLPGAKAYPTIQTQSQRFVQQWSSSCPSSPTATTESRGKVEAQGKSLFSIWSDLNLDQKSRLSRLEGLDEVEEIDMLLKHYCIVHAKRRTQSEP